jgi:hypothetical protein
VLIIQLTNLALNMSKMVIRAADMMLEREQLRVFVRCDRHGKYTREAYAQLPLQDEGCALEFVSWFLISESPPYAPTIP